MKNAIPKLQISCHCTHLPDNFDIEKKSHPQIHYVYYHLHGGTILKNEDFRKKESEKGLFLLPAAVRLGIPST
jgi:hypothetical protein